MSDLCFSRPLSCSQYTSSHFYYFKFTIFFVCPLQVIRGNSIIMLESLDRIWSLPLRYCGSVKDDLFLTVKTIVLKLSFYFVRCAVRCMSVWTHSWASHFVKFSSFFLSIPFHEFKSFGTKKSCFCQQPIASTHLAYLLKLSMSSTVVKFCQYAYVLST